MASGCYLQAEIQSAGGYFGYILNNSGEYVDYFKSPTTTDEIKTKLFNFIPVSGSWSGKLKAKNNPQSQNYYGPGDYLLSFRRFSGNSLSATSTDSNSLPVSLTLTAPISSPTITPETTPTPTPTQTSFTLKTSPPIATVSPTKVPIKTLSPKSTTPIASMSAETSNVLGDTDYISMTPLPDSVNSLKDVKKPPYLPIILIISGISFITISIFSMIKGSKKQYTDGYEKEDSQIH